MACEVPCDERHTLTIRAWRGTARGSTSPKNRGEVRTRLIAKRQSFVRRDVLSCAGCGLVPFSGAANALAEIKLRNIAQQFPRPADVGQGVPDVAPAWLSIGRLA